MLTIPIIINFVFRPPPPHSDIVTIDKGTGKISKLGRSFTRARDYDAMGPTVSRKILGQSFSSRVTPPFPLHNTSSILDPPGGSGFLFSSRVVLIHVPLIFSFRPNLFSVLKESYRSVKRLYTLSLSTRWTSSIAALKDF